MNGNFPLRASSLDFAYGPDFKMASVDYSMDSKEGLFVLVENRVMDKIMYHRLPEHRDWEVLTRGHDFAVVGRVELDPDFLDLVVVSEVDGDLRSAFIHRDAAMPMRKNVRAFMRRCWNHAPIITLQEDRNKRSTK